MSVFSALPSLMPRSRKDPTLLCLPEKYWTCDGTGRCAIDGSPETLAGWKIDLSKGQYALCFRSGTQCGEWHPIRVDADGLKMSYTAYDSGDWHPETFKIDRESGKFVAVRLSGGFQSFDFSKSPFRSWPDATQLQIRQRYGTCIEVAAAK
ncbi:MAG: hypothetical protein ACTHQM_06780 [Thermoanaerobaculia bacterium]